MQCVPLYTKFEKFSSLLCNEWEPTETWASVCSADTQEDPGGLGHGPGLPPVLGPAGLHARAHLPRRERPGILSGSHGGGTAQYDQRVSCSSRSVFNIEFTCYMISLHAGHDVFRHNLLLKKKKLIKKFIESGTFSNMLTFIY